MGLFNFRKSKQTNSAPQYSVPGETHKTQESVVEELMRQSQVKQQENEVAVSAEDLAPEKMDGKKLRYHYKDVPIYVNWKYGGRYDETLDSLGVKRGDKLRLVRKPTEDDLDNVAVFWKTTEIGSMKANRMRNMVIEWQEVGFPVFAAVNLIGEQHKLLAEIAFYGYIKRS